jgi:dihydrofolate synthase/folylpolyglutamate synthase
MTYSETLNYLYSQLPMFHRIGSAAYKANLDNTVAICRLLGNPENKFRSIHIAGTNGKGSVSHMLAAILQSAGYRTGLYTSPHLKDFRERIRINGKMIPKPAVTRFVELHRKAFDRIQPSFFEWTVGLAFDHFASESVDIAVIETGLGGRLDSTNVITPLLSIITNISYDHMNLLGDTLEKIAAEKAGIIKPGIPALIGESQREIRAVFEKTAREGKSPLVYADQRMKLVNARQQRIGGRLMLTGHLEIKGKRTWKNIRCDLPGLYQRKNIPAAVSACILLAGRCGLPITETSIRKGLASVKKRTGLRGRWEELHRSPLVIADTGHNEAGIREVLKQVKLTPHQRLHVVLGMVNDKDVSKILKLLPRRARYYFCKAGIPRALDEHALAAQAIACGLQGDIYPTVKKALAAAKALAGKKDLVLVGGSTFTVADAL